MPINLSGQNVSIDKNLSINQNTQVLTGSIRWENTEDYYSFNFSSRSSLNLALNDLYANLNVQVLDSNGQEVAGSYNRRNRDELISTTLEAGNYYIKVYRFRNATSDYTLKYSVNSISQSPQSVGAFLPNAQSSPQNAGAWLDMVIQDVQLREVVKSSFSDSVIDRNDVIKILRSSSDEGVVDATEFKDLKNLVSNASVLGMPEYVRVLTNKVVNGDPANQRYQYNSLGNLSAGSSSAQIENLVNKWFLGRDYPQTSYTYKEASGSLFQNGVSYKDIKQGQINDCYFLAGLAATAFNSPTTIEKMFIDNGDNTYTVRFFRNQIADYVSVDKYLPTDYAGNFVYASKGTSYNNSGNELWVALAEKAYAQLNESGWIYQDNTNSYSGIGKGGYVSDALSQITGNQVSMSNVLNLNSIIKAISSGESISLASKSTGVAPNIIAAHAYIVVNYNSSTQRFTLFSPWGIDVSLPKPGILEISWSEIESNFSYWDATRKYT